MDKSVVALCDALKKVIWQLKPQDGPLSFLIVTGKEKQGKTALLKQCSLQHVEVYGTKNSSHIYYNSKGVIVELSDGWLNQSKHLLQYTLKQLNRCHSKLKISGVILCIEVAELFAFDPAEFAERAKSHIHLLEKICAALGYSVETNIFFTKLDVLAGFGEFFQYEHTSDLNKPLGFSIDGSLPPEKILSSFKIQFNQFVESLGSQVIQKMHPARSNIKRTLIREFPLQLATLSSAIQFLIQCISEHCSHLQALYFCSAEQGGVSLDRLNRKIKHEYALTVQDKFPQARNYRACFIEGALLTVQEQTLRYYSTTKISHKRIIAGFASVLGLFVIYFAYQHIKIAHVLDEAGHELATYEMFSKKNNETTLALYHLAKASNKMDNLSANVFSSSALRLLKNQIHVNTKSKINRDFLPNILKELEQIMTDSRQSQVARYQALKVYLMLGTPTKFSQNEVENWFKARAQLNHQDPAWKPKLALLKQALRQPFQAIAINRQVVNDTRNDLNALPLSYLYYSLIKSEFPQNSERLSLEGFELAAQEVPAYLTKSGFTQIIAKLPTLAARLQAENWVLARQDLNDLPTTLQQSYCLDYVLWWQNFMRKSRPLHAQNYQQSYRLLQLLNQTQTFARLVEFIQKRTAPEFGDHAELFNSEIASKFTQLNLMSQSTLRALTENLNELEKFIRTLSIVNDHGKTAFMLAKSRFQGSAQSDPLSVLYSKVSQLPEPVASWAKNIADDSWFILMEQARMFINQQWQSTVFQEYQANISGKYPFASSEKDVALADFEQFFSRQGKLNFFLDEYLKPFLNTANAQWELKELNGYVFPISSETIDQLIRANVIGNMFFPHQSVKSQIEFTLEKLNLDPIVSSLQLSIGTTEFSDDQNSNSFTHFQWPQSGAKLTMESIEGNHYVLEEDGPWAFFKILQKVNVLVDEQDSSLLQILFEVNGNSGRYVLKAQNPINPFIPGILNNFVLSEWVV